MRDEPAEISCDRVTGFLNEHWGLRAAEVTYAPIGFGSHHWIAFDADGPRWFVTADRLDPGGNWLGSTAEQVKDALEAAAPSTRELADSGYEFVVAPLPDRPGRLVREALPGWLLVVLPHRKGGALQAASGTIGRSGHRSPGSSAACTQRRRQKPCIAGISPCRAGMGCWPY